MNEKCMWIKYKNDTKLTITNIMGDSCLVIQPTIIQYLKKNHNCFYGQIKSNTRTLLFRKVESHDYEAMLVV
jgi:hypothetical protein